MKMLTLNMMYYYWKKMTTKLNELLHWKIYIIALYVNEYSKLTTKKSASRSSTSSETSECVLGDES